MRLTVFVILIESTHSLYSLHFEQTITSPEFIVPHFLHSQDDIDEIIGFHLLL